MLQFKIQIKNIKKPPVWRQVLVPETFTFHRFHEVIQAAFGWSESHLYLFSLKGYNSNETISIPSEDDWRPVTDATQIKLNDIFIEEGQTYTYIYDFGDDWIHSIKLEKVTDEKKRKAACIGGKGSCPPEDCGGPWAYEEIKEVFASQPDSDEANNFREWFGLETDEIWDPNEFDLKEANDWVREV